MINPRKQHKAALDGGGGGAQVGLNESFGICHGAQNDLHRIKSRLNQTVLSISDKNWPLLRDDWVTADHFGNFEKYELDREPGWAALRICPHPGT